MGYGQLVEVSEGLVLLASSYGSSTNGTVADSSATVSRCWDRQVSAAMACFGGDDDFSIV